MTCIRAYVRSVRKFNFSHLIIASHSIKSINNLGLQLYIMNIKKAIMCSFHYANMLN